MIKSKDAISTARSLIGTPYAQLDCINLIKKVIRTSPGGVQDYTTAGSNSLWQSYNLNAKYRDLTWRQTGLAVPEAGMLAFKASGNDYHHVGIVTGNGTIIHSSSTQGGRGVVETPLSSAEGWTHLAIHRYIETGDVNMSYLYEAVVSLADENSYLNVRNAPSGDVIGKLYHGAPLEVWTEKGDWAFVHYGDSSTGYVNVNFLAHRESEPAAQISTTTTLVNSDGMSFVLVGEWRVMADD